MLKLSVFLTKRHAMKRYPIRNQATAMIQFHQQDIWRYLKKLQ